MKLRWTSVTWSIVYLLLLLSLATSLTFVTAFFLIVPGILLYVSLSTKSFIVHVVPVWIIASLIHGPIIILLGAYFLIPSIVMGHFYKKRASSLRTVLSGAGTIMAEFLLLLLISTVFFNFNISAAIEEIIYTAMEPLQSMTTGASMPENNILTPEYVYNMTVSMIPYSIIVFSLTLALLAHAIVRPTLASMGQAVPKFPPFRDWRFPRSLIWYYLICVLIELLTGASAQDGFLGTILLNLMPLLQFFFMVQTVSFFFYVAYHKKWNPVFPILLIFAVLFLPLLWIFGIMDIAFRLRERIKRSE